MVTFYDELFVFGFPDDYFYGSIIWSFAIPGNNLFRSFCRLSSEPELATISMSSSLDKKYKRGKFLRF